MRRLSKRICVAVWALGVGVGMLWACGVVEQAEDQPGLTLKPSLLESGSMLATPRLVDCTLEDGSQTQCYQLVYRSNPHGHGGPYCPKTSQERGGLGIYDGNTRPGLHVLGAALWSAMKSDGFDVLDESGNVKVVDPGAGMAGGPPQGGPPPQGGMPPQGAPAPPGGSSGPGAACLEATPNDQLQLTFLIPAKPVLLKQSKAIGQVEFLGISKSGVPIHGHPPTVAGTGGGMPGGGGAIPAIDPCGGHMDPAGYYHWHFGAPEMDDLLKNKGIDLKCGHIGQSSTVMIGYAKDGHPIYASRDMDGTTPADLDACQGHVAATREYPQGVYHYHVSTKKAPNLPSCLRGASVQRAFQR